MKTFFEIQPAECRMPLAHKELNEVSETMLRVLYFDPTSIYNRIGHLLNPYERFQSVPIAEIFPFNKIKNRCDCGCEKELTGRQRRWHNCECREFAEDIWRIICGYNSTISNYVIEYYGRKCIKCGSSMDEIDHTIGIKQGGGRSWLSNYKPLCTDCHRKKTNTDFGWKKPKKESQLTIKFN